MMPITAYTLDPDFSINGWESLEGTNLVVGYPRGIKASEDNIDKLRIKSNPLEITKQGINVLLTGRIGLNIDDSNSVDMILTGLSKKRQNANSYCGNA